jgi:Ca2+-binding EF-hand superfamily protein
MPRGRYVRGILVLAGLMTLTTAGPVLSQRAIRAMPGQPTAAQLFLQQLPPGQTLERYQSALRNDFANVDADADGEITQRDVDLHILMEGVAARRTAIMTVFGYDLDGDGYVTEDEVRRSMAYNLRAQTAAANKVDGVQPANADAIARQIDNVVRTIVALDTDKDGRVSLAEGVKYGLAGAERRAISGQAARARQLLTIDGVANGVLTLAAYQAAGEALFRQVDADKDGAVSQQELTDHATRAERAGCEMPAASDKARVVLLSSYQTEALSSVALGSQDSVVHAGRVVIEPGDEPLYVVIASYSATIWQFSGAVERVERLVMSSTVSGPNGVNASQPPLVGATGLAPDKVSFLNKANCLTYFPEHPSSSSLLTVAAVRTATGKAPQTVAARYSVAVFNLPSGTIESVREQKRAPLIIEKTQGTLKLIGDASNVIVQTGPSRAKDELYRFSPGGVIEIDPKSVVSNVPAARYEVLPQQAGLVQLLASGALQQNGLGEFIVSEKIRFPAGLNGAHSVTFLVLSKVPYPDGDPGHSCVIVADTGEKKGGCRR